MQTGEQREAAAERIVPEEELEGGGLLVATGPPVRVGHGELVHVGEQRRDSLPDGPLHGPACVAGRRCHVTPGPVRLTGAQISGTWSPREQPPQHEEPSVED